MLRLTTRNRFACLLLATFSGLLHLTGQTASRVVAWGYNAYGQATVPADLSNVVAVAAGNFHSMALKQDGTVAVWGDSPLTSMMPAGLSNVVAVAAYGDQCLVLKADGRATSWALDSWLQTPPFLVPFLTNVIALAGRNDGNLALTADGLVHSWPADRRFAPVPGLSNIVAVAGGDLQTLALQEDGRVYDTGLWEKTDPWGFLTVVPATTPTNLSDVIALGAGNCQSVALKADGTLYSWGINHHGGETNLPTGLTNIAAISIAHNHSLALRDDGTVVAWGQNLFANESSVPVGLTNVIMIAAGAGHNLALVGDGSPAITVQPRSRRFYERTPATLSGRVVGSAPMSYQWQCSGTNIPAASATTLFLPDCQVSDTGDYTLVASNALGVAVSRAVRLTVLPGQIAIATQPASQTNNAGLTTRLTVLAAGTPPLRYQWRKDELELGDTVDISGSQSEILTFRNPLHADNGGYSVVISNMFGSITSAVANLSIVDPAVNSVSGNGPALAGDTVSLYASAGGTPPLSYQWFHGDTMLADSQGTSGARSNRLVLSEVLQANAGLYSVLVTNVYGAATGAVTLSIVDPVILFNPTNRIGNVGDTVALNVVARGTALVYQWRKNNVNVAGGTRPTLTLTNLQWSDRGLYDAVVSNAFGCLTSSQAQLTVNMAPPDAFDPAPDSTVDVLALQPDGKILVGGDFTRLRGQARAHLGRLNSDGSLDSGFNPGTDGTVNCLAVQPNGQIVVAGAFTALAGAGCNGLGRLNPDGSRDPTFNAEAGGTIYSLALAPDGRLLVAGFLSTADNLWCGTLARLSTAGALDRTFMPVIQGIVQCLALQPDGKVLIGGDIVTINSQNRPYLARLSANGSPDATFNPAADDAVLDLLVQPDGKILISGRFMALSGQTHQSVGRLFASGAVDNSVNVATAWCSAMALQTDGKTVLGGGLLGLAGANLGRFNGNGSVDLTFDPGADFLVFAIALESNGNLLLGGDFTQLAGVNRTRLARLLNTSPAPQDLFQDGSRLVWLRGGAGPEVWRTTFEYATNSMDWISLGAGTRLAGGWQVTAESLPTNCLIRARGFVATIKSSWFVESRLALSEYPPAILVDDEHLGFRNDCFGFNFTGSPAQRVVVQSSTDLLNWVSLATNVLSDQGAYFVDTDSANYARRFYRLKCR